jgi:hypothetical protein
MIDEIKKAQGRQPRFTDEFKVEAVRLVVSSGRPLSAVARDLGVGLSTLSKWVAAHKEADLLPRMFLGLTRMFPRSWRGFARKMRFCGRSAIY